jgi:hypothetical protein
MVMFVDSDWAGDKENRHSVTGYVIYLYGVPILWKSRLQRTVALSSAEDEYYALSEAAKEVKFVVQILETLKIKAQMPIIVQVDNIGAIFMAENNSATSRTRHVDGQYHFIREFVEDNFNKIIFVKTEENKADIFTKNISSDVYDRHMKSFITSKENFITE